MKYTLVHYIAIVLTSQNAVAQQGTSNAIRLSQAQTAPCVVVQVPTPAAKPNSSGLSVVDRWKNKLNDQAAKLGTTIGVPMPTTDDLGRLLNAKPVPCPPVRPNTELSPLLKLPNADYSVVLRCNPLVASPKGTVGGPGFTLPDPHAYGLPEANQLEGDATPDVNAKTPCYQLKVNPKTNKYFVAAQ